MLSASLFLTLLSTAPLSVSTADDGQCLLVEDAAAVDAGASVDVVALEPAPCSYEPAWTPAPAIIDCNDVHASIWVGSMIGVCDMPRNLTAPSLLPGPPPARGVTCEGPSCTRHHQPLRAVERSDDNPRPILAARLLLLPPLTFSRVRASHAHAPRSVERDRLERPPRV
jgi:hypothetical protein